jgi:capsular polysaccharide transport system permease protein
MLKRTGLRVMLDVWRALFLREAFSRITADRLGWSWIFIEPVLHVAVMLGIRQLIGRVRVVPGVEFIPFLIVGILTFFLFRDVVNRTMTVVNANAALFAYRQVQPIDTVIVRAGLELCIKVVLFFVMVFGLHLLGYSVLPADPLQVVFILVLLWWLALGLGMVFCVLVSTFQESEKFLRLLMMPLYFLSGVILPVHYLPHSVQQWLWWNPILHAVELSRMSFFDTYHTLNNLSVFYVAACGTGLVLLGLLMQIRYKTRMLVR